MSGAAMENAKRRDVNRGGADPVRLTLPAPPLPRSLGGHHMVTHSKKRAYQEAAWIRACLQSKPPRDPPSKVRVSAHFVVKRRVDPDNLRAALKFPLDTLKQKQLGSIAWRHGLYDLCGYFVDDDPSHLELGEITQTTDRANPRVEISIENLDNPI